VNEDCPEKGSRDEPISYAENTTKGKERKERGGIGRPALGSFSLGKDSDTPRPRPGKIEHSKRERLKQPSKREGPK